MISCLLCLFFLKKIAFLFCVVDFLLFFLLLLSCFFATLL